MGKMFISKLLKVTRKLKSALGFSILWKNDECPSGKLSKAHLQRLFKRVFPVGDSENFCDYIFRLFDDDGNNVLEFKEFLQVSSIYFSRFSIRILLFVAVKVIIDKSHGEVSLLEQDRIENVS